jgi:hypothetical protein
MVSVVVMIHLFGIDAWKKEVQIEYRGEVNYFQVLRGLASNSAHPPGM